MRLSIKEKAGVEDVSKIYEGIHLSESFIRNSVINPDSITPDSLEEGGRHFGICDKCRNKKEGFLQFDKKD